MFLIVNIVSLNLHKFCIVFYIFLYNFFFLNSFHTAFVCEINHMNFFFISFYIHNNNHELYYEMEREEVRGEWTTRRIEMKKGFGIYHNQIKKKQSHHL